MNDNRLDRAMSGNNDGRSNPSLSGTNITVSPFATVPHEILTTIFLDCNDTSRVNLPPGRQLYPWKLGHVCSRWRKVLWNSPEIWRYIDVHGDGGYYSSVVPYHYFREALNDILTRTEGLICLSVIYYESCMVSDLVLGSSHRFRSLKLDGITLNTLFTLLELPRGSLAHLESLDVTLNGLSDPLAISSRFETLRHDLPSLRRLHIGGFAPGPSYIFYLPLSQLTNLSIRTRKMGVSEIYSILRHCSSLLTAELHIHSSMPASLNDPPTKIILPDLKTFIIAMRVAVDLESLLNLLVLPSLSSLATYSQAGPEVSHALSSLLSRSGCALQQLSMYAYSEPGPHPHLSQLLVHTPNLISFSSTYVASPTCIRLVHSGQLPHLLNATWLVYPDGLVALLDILDERVDQSPVLPDHMCRIRVTCMNARDAAPAWARFAKNCEAYKGAGFDIAVHGINGIDVWSIVGGTPFSNV